MISHILRSEFILNKKVLLMFLVMVVALAVIYPLLLDASPKVVLGASAVYLSFFPASALARQSKFKADVVICSLPVTRNKLVIGKYLFTALLFCGGLVLISCILLALPGRQYALADVLSANRVVNFLFAVGAASALLIPLILRFGFTGILIFVLGLNVLTVILFVLTYLKLIGNLLDFFFRGLPAAVASLRNAMGAPWYHLLVLLATCLLWGASMVISQKIYARKEL